MMNCGKQNTKRSAAVGASLIWLKSSGHSVDIKENLLNRYIVDFIDTYSPI